MAGHEGRVSVTEVVVVGAGLAGLCAAATLTAAGLDVLVLEAGNRPGGRVATDVVDGFRLDRGFQVLNTAYPEVRRSLDLAALQLCAFEPGALVHVDGALHRLADPRRRPRHAWATLTAPVGSLNDKLRLAAFSGRDAVVPARWLKAAPEMTTADVLRRRGLSPIMIDRFLRPFLSGVLLDSELETSSRYFDLVWRSFARGSIAVPSVGMDAIPAQLAARLPAGALRLDTRVHAVTAGGVQTDNGRLGARVVLVATDPGTASRLLPGIPAVPMRSVTTYYHVANSPPVAEAILILDGEPTRQVTNSIVISNAAPSYSPDSRALISTSRLGNVPAGEPAVRTELARLYGVPTGDWEHLATVPVRDALPAAPPPLGNLRRPIRVDAGRYVAGDHRDTPSIQGAMVSGRRAAEAIIADLRV